MSDTKFDKVFQITKPADVEKLHGSAIDTTADLDELKKLREDMLKDHIKVDGRFLGGGALSLVFNTANDKDQEIPGAVTRIEYLGAPLDHPAVLRHAFGKEYGGYQVYVVPHAPDMADMKVTGEDIIRTIRLFKATGQHEHLADIAAPDNFTFLKDSKGEVIRYPEDASDPDFRGKPIAFVRDLNASLADAKTAGGMKLMGDAEAKLNQMGIHIDDLQPAPPECLDACKRQYTRTAELAESLRKAGVEPNTAVQKNWVQDLASRSHTAQHFRQ